MLVCERRPRNVGPGFGLAGEAAEACSSPVPWPLEPIQ